MGDRANAAIKQPQRTDRIYLYTHWEGTKLPETVRAALAKEGRARWDDHAYLTRIIFCAMTREAERGVSSRETGYGISIVPCDNDGYPFIVIDTDTQTVSFEEDTDEHRIVQTYSFEEYASQKAATWPEQED